jgi:hypothetical protein
MWLFLNIGVKYFTRKISVFIVVLFAYGTSCMALIFRYGLRCMDLIKLERGGVLVAITPPHTHTHTHTYTGRPTNTTSWLSDSIPNMQKLDGPSAAHVVCSYLIPWYCSPQTLLRTRHHLSRQTYGQMSFVLKKISDMTILFPSHDENKKENQ